MNPTPLRESPSISTTPAAPRPRRRYVYVAIAAATALVIGAVTAYFVTNRDAPIIDSGPTAVGVGSVDGVGDVLVDGEGRVLYLFEPDEASDVTCTGGCAAKWPPLVTAGDAAPEIGEGVTASAIATVVDQEGAQVVTYDNWPLYRYVSDQDGQMTGNGKDQNGGVWWALTPAGDRVKAN